MFGFKSKEETEHDEAIETAWRIHGAISDWTGKVDAKASFAFALESAGVATAVALADDNKVYSKLEGPLQEIFYWGGLLTLAVAAVFSIWVVIPRLRSRKVKAEYPNNFIYFGHLKFWDSKRLPATIKQKDLLPVLTHQMVEMSKISWKKHIAVIWSIYLALAGGAALVVCAALIRFNLTP
ncbi:Pycsar system effector family protein [Arthrobacter sp. Z4-13]